MVLDDAVLNDLFVHYLHVDGVKVDLGEEIVRRVIGEDGAAVCEEMIDERIWDGTKMGHWAALDSGSLRVVNGKA